MAIQIEKSFVVRASPDRVWEFLTDPYRVAEFLPGAAITEQENEQTYAGTMTVKVGPVSSSYRGKVTFERLDPGSWTAELSAAGQDVRGRGGADMKMTSRLVETSDGGTQATVTSEVNVTGILAQLGRGMIQDVSDQMFQTFTDAMRAQLETGEQGPSGASSASTDEALDMVALGASVGRKAVVRLLQRPGFWLTVAAIAVLVYLVWLR